MLLRRNPPPKVATEDYNRHPAAMETIERPNKRRDDAQWKEALALFLGGATVQNVSEKLGIPLGTVKARAFRDRWVELRNRTTPIVAEVRMTRTQAFVEGRNDGMEERGRKLRSSLSKAVHDQLERIPTYAPETLRDELDIATILGKAAVVASTVHGWDRESVSTSVRIGAMGDVDQEGEAPAIDAQ